MADYNGTMLDDILLDSLRFCSASIKNNSPAYLSVCDLEDVSKPASGTYGCNLPISMREHEKDGHVVRSFVDDYYNRIHIYPFNLNFGAIVSPLQEEVLVWNSYFVAKTCSEIVEVNGDEWDLTGSTPPFELNALAHTIFTIDITEEGSPTFEGSITFDFTGANDPIVLISGTRLALFRWRPQSDIEEMLEWLTDIIKGKDGSPQRISVRQIPRQFFKIDLSMDDERHQAGLDAAMFFWTKRTWGFPVWTELVLHESTINFEDTIINVDTTNADFRDESLGVIWKSPAEAEVVQIETVAAGSLTLSSPVQNIYTGAKLIMPCRIAETKRTTNRKNFSAGIAIYEMLFAVKDNILLTGYTPATTYKGLPVITEITAVDPTQKKTVDGDVVVTDYETGDFGHFSYSDFNINVLSHLFYNDNKAQAWDFRKFLHSLFGRQGCVYVPTGKNDLALAQGFGASDTSFNIYKIGLASNMGVNDLRKDLAFIFTGGTHYYREITGIVKSGSEEIVTIDSSLGIAVNPGDCIICFLDKVNLASDSAKMVWTRAHENICKLNWMAVKA